MTFRALWVGLVFGGGWESVRLDYALRDGQSWPLLLGVIVVSPLCFRGGARNASKIAGGS